MTDDELNDLALRCDQELPGEAHLTCEELRNLLAECKRGRATMLSRDDIANLGMARIVVEHFVKGRDAMPLDKAMCIPDISTCLDTIDRLIISAAKRIIE